MSWYYFRKQRGSPHFEADFANHSVWHLLPSLSALWSLCALSSVSALKYVCTPKSFWTSQSDRSCSVLFSLTCYNYCHDLTSLTLAKNQHCMNTKNSNPYYSNDQPCNPHISCYYMDLCGDTSKKSWGSPGSTLGIMQGRWLDNLLTRLHGHHQSAEFE